MVQPEHEGHRNEEALHEFITIGIAGPLGAGKSTAGALLEENFGFPQFTISNIFRRLATAQHFKEPFSRELLGNIYARLLNEQGEGAAVKLATELVETYRAIKEIAGVTLDGATIEGMRDLHEAVQLKQSPNSYLVIVIVTATKQDRFERIVHRERVGDITNWDDFNQRDVQEEERLRPLFDIADLIITNSGNVEEFEQQLLHFVFSKTKLF